MPTTVTMDLEDYTSLAARAEEQALSTGGYVQVREMTEKIERANGITRYYLLARWRDADAGPIGNHEAGDDWPPLQTLEVVRHTNPWDFDSVMVAIHEITIHPFSIELTRDRTGVVGWKDISSFFGI